MSTPVDPAPVDPAGPAPVGKGRPTPKRSEARGRRGGPIGPPPANRKEAAKRAKEQALTARASGRSGAVRAGDRMLARDAGPVRAAVRDVVDARRSVGVLLLPLALALVLVRFTGNERLIGAVLLLWTATLLAMAAVVIVTTVLIRKRLAADFPGEGRRGRHVGYGLLRSTVLRRFRVPPPRVSPAKLRRAG